MFEKFVEKCKELSRNRVAVITAICVLLVLTVVISVSIATNRAKKQYGTDNQTSTPIGSETEKNGNLEQGTVQTPNHNSTEKPVSTAPEEFELALVASGSIAKGHDATIQVWSETMGDYRVHLGIDIATSEGAPVFAAADGRVEKVWDDALMGRCIAISHNGDVYTFYKNLNSTLAEGIEEGSSVKCGQKIGSVGNTAIAELADEPHLHLEMTVNGLAVDPRDYFSAEARESLTKGK